MGVALALAVPREYAIAHEALEHAGGDLRPLSTATFETSVSLLILLLK